MLKLIKKIYSGISDYKKKESESSNIEDNNVPSYNDTKISEEMFSVRTTNCLLDEGFETLGQLLEIEDLESLKEIQNFGTTCLDEVRNVINNLERLDGVESLDTKPKVEITDESILSTPIASVNFSVRTKNCLCEEGIKTIGQLLELEELEDLMELKNFGATSLKEVKKVINNIEAHLTNEDISLNVNFDLSAETALLKSRIKISNDSTLKISITSVSFSARTMECLKRLNISNIGDLLEISISDLLAEKNFGEKSILDILDNIALLDRREDNSKDNSPGSISCFHLLRDLIITAKSKIDLEGGELGNQLDGLGLVNTELKCIKDFFGGQNALLANMTQNQLNALKIILKFLEPRELRIFLLRHGVGGHAMTLEETGKRENITRERVRQICKGYEKKIKSYPFNENLMTYFELHLDELFRNKGIMTSKDFYNIALTNDIFLEEDVYELMIELYLCFPERKIYRVSLDGVSFLSLYKDEDINIAYNDLIDESENLLGLDKCQIREYLKLDLAYDQNVEDICIDLFLSREGIFEKDILIGIKKKTMLNMEYLLRVHTQGLHHDDLVKKYCNRFCDGIYSNSVRGFIDRSENIVLWGRGTYIHTDNININFEEFGRVYEKIKGTINNLGRKTSVIHIYQNNKALMDYLGISNQYALYSCLRVHNSNLYIYRQYPDIESAENLTNERLQLNDEIENYFKDADKELFWQEIEGYFIHKRGLCNYQITNGIAQSKNIYRVGSGRWIHKEVINLTDKVVMELLIRIRKEINDKRYVLLHNLLKTLDLPPVGPCHWNRSLLSTIIRKHSEFEVITDIAVLSPSAENIKKINDLILEIVKNSGIRFSKTSLEVYLRRNKISTNINRINDFSSQYGHLLEQ
jgi:DNA-directed RNA polymerase alpha subunit